MCPKTLGRLSPAPPPCRRSLQSQLVSMPLRGKGS
eukprot:SAG11_NODE_21929_length_415_cov_5.661392_1_plen_34_part_01